jgi:HAMP domain-containing protein
VGILLALVFAAPALLYLGAWRTSEPRARPLLIAALALHAGSLYLASSSAEGWRFGFA